MGNAHWASTTEIHLLHFSQIDDLKMEIGVNSLSPPNELRLVLDKFGGEAELLIHKRVSLRKFKFDSKLKVNHFGRLSNAPQSRLLTQETSSCWLDFNGICVALIRMILSRVFKTP